MKELHVDRETLEEMFVTINQDLIELNNRMNDLQKAQTELSEKTEEVYYVVKSGSVLTGARATVDNVYSENPTCDVHLESEGPESQTLVLEFHGLRGPTGQSVTGRRGNIILISSNTTDAEATAKLKQLTGTDDFIVGDLFINVKTYELMQCITGGKPNKAKFQSIGYMKDESENGPGSSGGGGSGGSGGGGGSSSSGGSFGFTGTDNQVVLGDGSVMDIVQFFNLHLDELKSSLNWFRGGRNQLVRGNGDYITVGELINQEIENIRNTLGIVTTEKAGLVPKLPPKK